MSRQLTTQDAAYMGTETSEGPHSPPDGTHVASGSEDKTVRVWSIATGSRRIQP
jgi:WD40 repeat protein